MRQSNNLVLIHCCLIILTHPHIFCSIKSLINPLSPKDVYTLHSDPAHLKGFSSQHSIAWLLGVMNIINGIAPWTLHVHLPLDPEYSHPGPSLFLLFLHFENSFSQTQSLIHHDALGYDPSAHEEEPTDLKAGISIKSLTKIYNQVSS